MTTLEQHKVDNPTDTAHIADIIRTASAGWALSAGDVVLANGSRFEGLGNRLSDVDAWVVLDASAQERRIPLFEWRDGYHLNVVFYDRTMVANLARNINALRVDDFERISAIPVNTLDRYYRVAKAYPAVNHAEAEAIIRPFSAECLARIFGVWAALRSNIEMDKARIALAAGRPGPALLCARRAVESAIDHHLADNGEAYPSLKWRFEKLARRFGTASPLYRQAWDMKAPGDRPAEAYLPAAERFCRQLGVQAFPTPPSYLTQAPSTAVFPLGDRHYLVQGRTLAFELNDAARWLWERLDGKQPEAALALGLASAFHLQPKAARRLTGRFTAQLLDMGLATYTTDTLF